MQARDHDVQLRQQLVGKIEFAVGQNVHFAAGEKPEIAPCRGDLFVDFFHRLELVAQARGVEAVGDERRFRVIGDGPVSAPQFAHVRGDVLQGVPAITPVRVVVQRALEIGPFDELWQLVLFRRGKLALVLAQLRRNVRKVEFLINLLFGPAGDQQFRVARLLLRLEEAVFVEAQSAFDGALAHHDIVFFASGEIGQRERKFRVADHPQIGLNAAL